MKKTRIIEVTKEVFIPHTFGKDNIYKGDILIYTIKRKDKLGVKK